MGPLVDARQYRRVLEYLDIAKDEGARLVSQAALPTVVQLANGYYVAPTLLSDVTPQMRVAREEIFGPVTCIIAFDTYDEAIEIANGTPYGLFASVFTADHSRAMRAVREIEAGVVFINNYYRALLGTPFGGMKSSGNGREHAIETMREFARTKNIRMLSCRGTIPYWTAATDVLA